MKPTPKTLLIAGNHAGGLYKTRTIGTLADSLQSLGRSVHCLSCTSDSSHTLKLLHQTTSCFSPDNLEIDRMLDEIANSEARTVILDYNGDSSLLAEHIDSLRNRQVRILVGAIVTDQPYTWESGLDFIKNFPGCEIIIFQTGTDSPITPPSEGERLATLAQGRTIHFPNYSLIMENAYRAKPAVPTAMIQSTSNPLIASSWQKHHLEVTKTIRRYASWLTARPIMTTFAKPEVLTPADPIATFERAVPLLLDILPGQSGSCCLIREIVWSLFNNHPVGLSRVCTLDQDRKDALLAVINLRMALGGDSNNYIRKLLVDAGVFDQDI